MPASGKLIAALVCVLAGAALAACGEAHLGTAANTSGVDPKPGHRSVPSPDPSSRSSTTADAKAVVKEVADPEEARSFPAPASVHHPAAATPAKAGKAIVAAGAPSDAEVRGELAQMKAVERSAKSAQKL